MPQPLRDILKELKHKGYDEKEDFFCWKQLNNQVFVQFIDRVQLEMGHGSFRKPLEYNCDTTVSIKEVSGIKPPRNSKYVIFSTPIPQLILEEIHCLNEVVNNLNVSNPIGKFILYNHNQKFNQVFIVSRNYKDFKIDIGEEKRIRSLVYVTNHCLSYLNSTVFEAHLQYHAKIILRVHSLLKQKNMVMKKSTS